MREETEIKKLIKYFDIKNTIDSNNKQAIGLIAEKFKKGTEEIEKLIVKPYTRARYSLKDNLKDREVIPPEEGREKHLTYVLNRGGPSSASFRLTYN